MNSIVVKSAIFGKVVSVFALTSFRMKKLALITISILAVGCSQASERSGAENRMPMETWQTIMDDKVDIPSKFDNRRIPYVLALIAIAKGLAERGDETAARELLRQISKTIPSDKSPANYSSSDVYMGLSEVYPILGDVDAAKSIVKDVKHPGLAINPMVFQWARNAGHLCSKGKISEGLAFISTAETAPKRLPDHWYFIEETAEIGLAYTKCQSKDKGREIFRHAQYLANQIPYCWGDVCQDHKESFFCCIDSRIVESDELDLLVLDIKSKAPKNDISAAIRLAQLGRPQNGLDLLVALEESRPKRYFTKYESEQYKLAQEKVSVKRARAVIAAYQGNNWAANKGFDDAYADAKSFDGRGYKGGELIYLAEDLADLHRCSSAIPVLRDARSIQEATLMDTRGPGRNEAREYIARIARVYAKCEMDAEALNTARFLHQNLQAVKF